MITTGIHIPYAVMRELAFAVEAIHRKTAAFFKPLTSAKANALETKNPRQIAQSACSCPLST